MSYRAGESCLLGKLIGANLNSTADQSIPIESNNYIIRKIVVTNRSATPTLAAGGIYPSASKGGTAIVAAGQLYTALNVGNYALDLTLVGAAVAMTYTAALLYLSLTTANGSASTADIYIFGDRLD